MDINGSLAGYYVLLVLLPQVAWFLLSSGGDLLAGCCGDSLISLYTLKKDTDDSTNTGECRTTEQGIDNLTAQLCSCSITQDDTVDASELDFLEGDGLGGW